MDMLSFMMGKASAGNGGGGGGGGGSAPYYAIIPDEITSTPGPVEIDPKATFTVEFEGETYQNMISAPPGAEVTMEATDDCDWFGACTWTAWANQYPDLVDEENVTTGDSFTFTMPSDIVVYWAGKE